VKKIKSINIILYDTSIHLNSAFQWFVGDIPGVEGNEKIRWED